VYKPAVRGATFARYALPSEAPLLHDYRMEATEGAGLLIHWDHRLPPRPSFLGSCFAFGDERTYLTAAHCMPDGDEERADVHVMRPGRGGMRQVLNVRRHPSADLAVLQVNPIAGAEEPFWTSVAPCQAGDDFVAFGFPEDTINGIAGTPTARVFKGNIQRLFNLENSGGVLGAEMSIPAPAGLSGGVVAERGEPSETRPFGLVLSNRESEIYVARYEDREVIRAITRYGTALVLEPLSEWLAGSFE
jgi:hypothetical protein